YIYAVEDVADVVENTGGDLRHTGLPRGVLELFVNGFELCFGFFALGDVFDGGDVCDDDAAFRADRRCSHGDPADFAAGRAETEFADEIFAVVGGVFPFVRNVGVIGVQGARPS